MPMAPMRSPIGSSRQARSRPSINNCSNVSCPAKTFGSRSRAGTAADERKITAGGQEPSSRAGDAPGAGDRGHLEVVTEDEAGEAETPPEQAADDLGGERRWEGRVENAIPHVGDHHRRAAGSEGGAEWNEMP